MEFLLSLLIRLCQGAQGNTKILMFHKGIICRFSVLVQSGQIPHFVRDDKFFKCHSERQAGWKPNRSPSTGLRASGQLLNLANSTTRSC